MKTLTINWVSWIKTFFMPANSTLDSRPVLYQRVKINSKKYVTEDDRKPGMEKRKPGLGDLMRTAHRGNFSAGPTFLFHPGWFK